MPEMLLRELIYFWHYFDIQFRQIAGYWILGMALGSFISVFGKERIHSLFTAFMITGPATKITNLGAVKIVLGLRDFIFYLAFTALFALLGGFFVDYATGL
jgi:uncharacterized membrane protein YraQ (UPF0718 family)